MNVKMKVFWHLVKYFSFEMSWKSGGDVFHRQNFCRWKKVNVTFFHRQFLIKLKIWLSIFFSSTNVNFFSSTKIVILNIRDCQHFSVLIDFKLQVPKNFWWKAIFLYENYDFFSRILTATTPSNSLKSLFPR